MGKVNYLNRNLGALIRALAKTEFKRWSTPPKEAQRDQSRGVLHRLEKVISVVIPAYNEEKAIQGVLAHIPRQLLGYRVEPIVIVDGAQDNTEIVVREQGHLVATHMVNRGQGDALRTGFDIALSRGADIVMTMDADGQHRAEDMVELAQPVINGAADYVMGSRFLRSELHCGEYEERGGWRHGGILFFTGLINLLAGTHITDCTNGFRAIRAEGLARLTLKEDRFNAAELIMEAARNGLRIQEVPVAIKKRAAGTSKKPSRLGYPLGFLATILKVWLR